MQFGHQINNRQNQPFPHTLIQYGSKKQWGRGKWPPKQW
jgi:hypothetical protein